MNNQTLPGPPPRFDPAQCALFLDLDGTLAEIAPRPSDVSADAKRTRILRNLIRASEGCVAILTGRALADADRILEGSVPAVAAVHGLVRRMPGGAVLSHLPAAGLRHARMALEPFADEQGVTLEDKGSSVALHYRAKPEAEPVVRHMALTLSRSLGLAIQEGAMVCELRTPGPNKGDALNAFLSHPPFADRLPVMVGDDLTDEDAFAAAEAAGGYGVLVGEPRSSHARYRLGSVPEVLDWLDVGSGR